MLAGHLQQLVIIKKLTSPTQKLQKSNVGQTTVPWVSCAVFSGVSWVTLHRVFSSAILSEEYQDNIEQDFYMCNVAWSLFDKISQGFYQCTQCCPQSIRTTLNRTLSVQCCLERLGQYCSRFLSCTVLSQEYQDNIKQDFFLCNVVWSFLDNIA